MIFVVVSTGHFDPLIEKCNQLSDRYEFVGQIGSSTVLAQFKHFRTAPPPEIQRHMREAELVISHAGSGMTVQLFKMEKPFIVIPKQRRYGEPNDMQVQLAKKWEAIGSAILCMDIDELEAAIERCRRTTFRYPAFPSLGAHLRQLIL